MKNKISFYLISGLLISVLVLFLAFSVSAQESEYSLTLNCLVKTDKTEKAVVGDEFAIIKIADCTVFESNHNQTLNYQTVKRFEEFDCPWLELSASKLKKQAKEISANVTNQDYVDKQTTDQNGQAKFSLKDAGFFLIIRTKAVDSNISFEPFLISLPQIIDGKINYQVVSSPKFEASQSNPIIPTLPDNGGHLPQTGQLNLPMTIFAALGILMIFAGWYFIISGKNHEKH